MALIEAEIGDAGAKVSEAADSEVTNPVRGNDCWSSPRPGRPFRR